MMTADEIRHDLRSPAVAFRAELPPGDWRITGFNAQEPAPLALEDLGERLGRSHDQAVREAAEMLRRSNALMDEIAGSWPRSSIRDRWQTWKERMRDAWLVLRGKAQIWDGDY